MNPTYQLGGQAPASSVSNPRTAPLYKSKALAQHKRQKTAHQEDGQEVGHAKHPVILQHRASHGSGSDESASKWFDNANENVPVGQDRFLSTHDEPPFFLDTQPIPPPNGLPSSASDGVFGREQQSESENEELRGVIDDLTVENKWLRKMVKHQRSSTQPMPEAKDRLFDVRVYGLSADKKRELEALLRNFTAQTDKSSAPASRPSATHGRANTSGTAIRSSTVWPTLPQHTAKSKPTDSGYASNSQSERTSAAASNASNPSVPVPKSSRNRNIKSYLHDVPDTVLPRLLPIMSERAKQVLVVRRLEQLFTGQNAAPGGHSQPIQQQEVSLSAAKAEARLGRMAQVEGAREALAFGNEDSSETDSCSPNKTAHPDQRPTRPLDLNIHRAQIASDNIEYIRHLGFSTPVKSRNENYEQSWIYLNLIASMAQLHTLNVTPAFVRTAIRKLSTKFELSDDGKQVRWRGGSEATQFVNFDERELEGLEQSVPEQSKINRGSSSKRSMATSSSDALISEEPLSEAQKNGILTAYKSNLKNSTVAASNLQTASLNPGTRTSSAFGYKPLVYKGEKYSSATSYLDSMNGSSPSEESGEFVRMFTQSKLNQRRDSVEGKITFYSNPFFCSDASADKSSMNWKPQRQVVAGAGLGMQQEASTESPLRHLDACYFTPQFAPKPSQGGFDEREFSMEMIPIQVAGEQETQPIEYKASGIGGVTPEDNFAMDVKVVRRVQKLQGDAKLATAPIPAGCKGKKYSYRIASCDMTELPPSKLPTPSYNFFSSSSSSANAGMEDSDSDSSSSADEEDPASLQFLNRWSTGSFQDESGEEGEGDDGSDSIDMLPDRIATQDREYLLTRLRRVEGSLAATVGASRTASSVGEPEVDEDDVLSQLSIDSD